MRYYYRHNIAVDVYMACRYLGVVDCIMAEVVDHLRRNFGAMNMLRLLEFAWSHKDSIFAEARDFVALHIEQMYELPSFADFPVTLLLEVLNSPDLAVTEEEVFIDIIAEWLSKDSERKSDISTIISALKPNCSLNMELIEEWSLYYIAVALKTALYTPEIASRPFKSWICEHDDPLYISKAGERISVFHFEGTLWSELDKPMLTVPRTERVCTQAARRQQHLFLTTPNERKDHCRFVLYDYRRGRLQDLRPVDNSVEDGLFWVNDKLYACSGPAIQRYSSQYDLWLKPMESDMVDMTFYASDGRFLYCYASADGNQYSKYKCIYVYDDRCRYWNRVSSTTKYSDYACGGFVDGQLYAVDKSFIDCVDLRAGKWEYILPLPALSRRPLNLTKCRDKVVVLDVRNNTFLANVKERRWLSKYYSDYFSRLNVVHCVDYQM